MSRRAAENSLRSAFSFAATVIWTHFALGKSLNNSIASQSPKEAKETIDLVSKLNNNMPCMPADANLIFSTDNSSIFAFEGMR